VLEKRVGWVCWWSVGEQRAMVSPASSVAPGEHLRPSESLAIATARTLYPGEIIRVYAQDPQFHPETKAWTETL
jgi:hypothetical protein